MIRISCSHFFSKHICIAIFYSCIGLLAGAILSLYTRDISLPIIQQAIVCKTTPASFLFLVFLPLIFTAFTVYYCKPPATYFLCFAKFICYGFIGQALCNAFYTRSWFVRIFLLCIDTAVTFSMLLMIFTHSKSKGKTPVLFFTILFVFCSLIWFLDYFYISPCISNIII